MPTDHDSDAVARAQAQVDREYEVMTQHSLKSLLRGVDADTIVAEIVSRGINQRYAEACVRHAITLLNEERRKAAAAKGIAVIEAPPDAAKNAAKFQMILGCIALVLGALVTATSYGMAEPGGKYLWAYGVLMVGAWNVLRGLWKYSKA